MTRAHGNWCRMIKLVASADNYSPWISEGLDAKVAAPANTAVGITIMP